MVAQCIVPMHITAELKAYWLSYWYRSICNGCKHQEKRLKTIGLVYSLRYVQLYNCFWQKATFLERSQVSTVDDSDTIPNSQQGDRGRKVSQSIPYKPPVADVPGTYIIVSTRKSSSRRPSPIH